MLHGLATALKRWLTAKLATSFADFVVSHLKCLIFSLDLEIFQNKVRIIPYFCTNYWDLK